MVEYIHALLLAALQGFTEFLPISSSGHLILLPSLLGWPDQGLAFDVAVHVGSLLAVLVYFRLDISLILRDWLRSLGGGPSTPYSRLAWSIAWATIMVAVAGYYVEDLVNRWLREPVPVALATIIFGLLLWWADRAGRKQRKIEQIGWLDVLVVGCAQVFALIPGTSRSGVTITAGLAMGLTREAAARFSFLMAIPVIALVGVWQSRKLIVAVDPVDWSVLLFATLVSALVAFACIHWFLGFVRRFSMVPFVIYRLFLGLILLWLFL
jgi:undecaprenyl-diphosphatase